MGHRVCGGGTAQAEETTNAKHKAGTYLVRRWHG